jgi:hypothetical protein
MKNMKKGIMVIALVFGLWGLLTPAFAGDHRIGLGGHYWKTVDDIDITDIDEDGIALVLSYQYKPTLLGLQFDVEIADKSLTGKNETVYSPQVFLIAGGLVYGGLGIGVNYADGKFSDKPFYVLKAGLDIELLPLIHLDINANYRFEDWDTDKIEEDIDTDTVTLGLVGRIEF